MPSTSPSTEKDGVNDVVKVRVHSYMDEASYKVKKEGNIFSSIHQKSGLKR